MRYTRSTRSIAIALSCAAIAILLMLATLGVKSSFYESNHLESKAKQLQKELQKTTGPAEHTKLDPSKPLREQTRVFELAGRRFEIPIMYIDGFPKPGEHQDSLLLEVIWPEMRSTWELKDRAEYDRMRNEEHRLGWILLHVASLRPSIEAQIEGLKRNIVQIELLQAPDSLEGYLWYRGTKEEPEPWYEIYLERDETGRVISYIDCSPKERGPFPRCNDKFIHGNLLHQVSYSKNAFLAEWQSQRQRTIDFMRNLEIEQKNISPKEKL